MSVDVDFILSKIKKDFAIILKENLFGIYIYGSLTCGDFRSKSSDIDFIVVTNKKLNKREFELLKKWYNKLLKNNYKIAKRLEMSYAYRGHLINPNISKSPYFFKSKFSRSAISDANSPIAWLNIRNSDITILGPKPREFVPEIDFEVLRKALMVRMGHLINNPKKYLSEDWSKVYVVLTFCRIFYTLKTIKITSKKRAAKWCLKHLPKTYRPIVSSSFRAFDEAAHWKNLNHPAHGVNERHREDIILLGRYISKQLRKSRKKINSSRQGLAEI